MRTNRRHVTPWVLVLIVLALGQGQWKPDPNALRVLPGFAVPVASAGEVYFRRTPLEITSAAGTRHRFLVEVAETAAQRSRGLMYRTHLAPDGGMLFLYPAPQVARMWMKDTLVSLDMLFIASDGRVLEVAGHTEPLSLRTIASTEPVLAVLELRAGRCAELGIGPGSRILHRRFESDTALDPKH